MNFDELGGAASPLGTRSSGLIEAILRVSASLDVTTVLRGVVESARALTAARYGVIVTVGDSGQVEEFFSSGVEPDVHRRLEQWPDGPRLFEHFRNLPGALRLDDLPKYAESLGYSSELMLVKTLQMTPMRHRGTLVGVFFLGEKEGGEQFTSEDEEVLLLFASQAAMAVSNARAHRDEQRARADLEALIDTSPVGVVVLDARTGTLLSSNREALRIFEALRIPGRSLEQLLEVLVVKRADGRQVSLAEVPLSKELDGASAVRAEEVEISVPDGRSLTTLINSTPVRSLAGDVESLVVTLQDLSPMQELERLRAEFMGMVSHELRIPLSSIKGSAATVRGAPADVGRAEMLEFFRIIEEQADHMHGLVSDLLDMGRIDAGTLSVAPEPLAVARLVEQARNTLVSGGGRNPVQIDLPPDLPWVLADKPRIVQVLNNLLSNACKNSTELTPVQISAARDGVYVAVSVADRGRGAAPEGLARLFKKYPLAVSGSEGLGNQGAGLGLVICKGLVEAHGGRIWAESGGVGQGMRITFTIPVAEPAATGLDRTSDRPGRPSSGATPVLVVDDDPEGLRYIRNALTSAGYLPTVTGDPQKVPALIERERPHLVLMDLLLPGTDGIELMEQIPALSDLPVIFVSAYGRDETIAKALERGAADYIVKPFSPTELVARIQSALRGRALPPEPFVLGDLSIDYHERRVALAGRPVETTATEFNLLRELSVNAGRVVTYDLLLRRVWSKPGSGDVRAIRAFIKKLRQKLGDDANNPTYISTVHRVGYRMAKPPDPHEPSPAR